MGFQRKEKREGLLGIRTTVWVTVCGAMFLTLLLISLSHEQSLELGARISSSSNDSAPEKLVMDRGAGIRHERRRLAPLRVRESRTNGVAFLNAEEAKALALVLANQKAKELFGCEPFRDGTSIQTVDGGWVW